MTPCTQSESTYDDIRRAAKRIAPFIHKTPIMTCRAVNEQAGAEVFFKCENLQKVGAFKIRGATNAVFSLSDHEASHGVATHSSGNHAAALAQAARWRGIKAIVVMPDNSPGVKKLAVAGYGADIVNCKPTLEARESMLAGVITDTGSIFIHPYDDCKIIEGQATAALELCSEVPDLQIVMAPVGGGGLLSGTGLAVHSICPHTRVVGAEPETVDDAYRSLNAGRLLPASNAQSIADGLLTSLSTMTFRLISQHVDTILTVSEVEIIQAMRFIWERMKLLIEPSAAVTVAALFRKTPVTAGKRIGVILSGGNVDLENLSQFRLST